MTPRATTPTIPPTDPSDVPMAASDVNARQGIIRDLYALAEFYTSNPMHPLPSSIQLHHKVDSEGQLRTVADRWADGKVYGTHPQCDHDLPGTSMIVGLLIRVAGDEGRPL